MINVCHCVCVCVWVCVCVCVGVGVCLCVCVCSLEKERPLAVVWRIKKWKMIVKIIKFNNLLKKTNTRFGPRTLVVGIRSQSYQTLFFSFSIFFSFFPLSLAYKYIIILPYKLFRKKNRKWRKKVWQDLLPNSFFTKPLILIS